jgi:hypothetical protein
MPPSRRHRVRVFSPKHNALLQQLSVGLFVAEARNGVLGDEIIGGIAVWLVEGASEPAVAHFGMFEVANNPEVGAALIEAAEFWVMERGAAEVIQGPFSLDDRLAPGLLTDGFNISPGSYLPYNPPYYPDMIEQAGYAPSADAYAFILPAGTPESALEPVHMLDSEREPGTWRQLLALAPVFHRAVAKAERRAFGLAALDEKRENVRFGLILIPNGGGTTRPRYLPGGLLNRRRGRLLALPVVGETEVNSDFELRSLYSEAVRAASALRFPEVICAPISTMDAPSLRALGSLGAYKVQTYQIFEKRF